MANGDGNENKILYISHSDTYNIGEINKYTDLLLSIFVLSQITFYLLIFILNLFL